MIYRPFHGLSLSALGFGAMRMPKTGSGESIDEGKARALIETAYAGGVNYFDTAYRYHGGESEPFLGKVLSQFPRDTWHMATKMPGHMMRHENGRYSFFGLLAGRPSLSPAQVFEEQLNRCAVDYFDFYLLHNVCETAYGFYTDEDVAVVEYLQTQKKAGRIRHLGFSAHGRADTIDRFLTRYPIFEFVQIQLNYLDWTLQDAAAKYGAIQRHGLPIVAMEPCRGGRLASLSPEADAMLKSAQPGRSIASWAFRFLLSLSGVQVILSGMTTMEQLQDNLATFSREDPLSDTEQALAQKAAGTLLDMIPCTACRYCSDECPKGLDIPKLISLYNEFRFENPSTLQFTMGAMKKEELPAACIQCGACAQVCPQGIRVPEVLSAFAEALAARK